LRVDSSNDIRSAGLDRGAERDQKMISGRGQDAAMKTQVRFGVSAAIRSSGVHLPIGPLDPRQVRIRAALGTYRTSLRLDDPAHL
jgi:hypothetical protein